MKGNNLKIVLGSVLCAFLIASISNVNAVTVGVKNGDRVKYTVSYVETPPSGVQVLDWFKVEFLNVTGTVVDGQLVFHMQNGTESNASVSYDVEPTSSSWYYFLPLVIAANSTVGYSFIMGQYGNVTITEETTRTYVGMSRTVLSANVSQYITQTFYWDKETGVMMEMSSTSGGYTVTAAEANLWSDGGLDWWIFALIAAIISIIAVPAVVVLLRNRKPVTSPAAPVAEQPVVTS